MRVVRGLVAATHAGPTALVTAFALAAGLASGLTGRRVLLLGAAVLAGQLTVGWLNDWHDAADDLAAGRSDKPVVRGEVSVPVLRTAFLVAAVAVVPLSLALGATAGLAHLGAVASAWSYDLRLKTTALSWAPFALSFGLLPLVVSTALPDAPLPAAAAVALAAVMGVAAHLTNGVKDMEADALTGVRGLPQRVGVLPATRLSAVLGVAAGMLLVAWRPGPVALLAATATALIGVVAVVAARSGASSLLFRLSMAASAPLAAGLVATGGVR